jgi:hypothetical protein
MARFARDCMQRARALTKKLEVTLGPDTGDLTMRAGLHSGPVTAGVLRGERSRFQLFGGMLSSIVLDLARPCVSVNSLCVFPFRHYEHGISYGEHRKAGSYSDLE